MKNRFMIQFGVLTAANCIVTILVFVTSQSIARHWAEILAGEPLPWVTTFTLHYAGPIAIGFVLLSLGGIFMSTRPQVSEHTKSFYFAGLTTVEILLLSCYTLGVIYPSMNIMYHLGKSG